MNYDIVIVGGGPAGLSFACSLKNAGVRVAIVEKQSLESLSNPTFDGRDIALTHQSVRILKELDVWRHIPDKCISSIREARVLDGSSPYSLNFDTRGESIDALGYLVSNHDIRKALFDEAQQIENLDIHAGNAVTSLTTAGDVATAVLADGQEVDAQLIVAADSRFSETRRMVGIPATMLDFGRVCIVCRMEHEKPNDSIAYECFHYGRTLAVLPLSANQSSIVVTAPMSKQDSIMGMSEAEFDQDIQTRFNNRYGDMHLVSERFAYPLVGVHASKLCTSRFALIGDAAVGMHPVTAHGFNLGLSGQEILAKQVIRAFDQGTDIGDPQLLRRFEVRHMLDTRPMYHGTNEIVKIFTDDRPPAKLLRKLTLRLANNLPPVKHIIRNKLTESQSGSGFLPSFFR
jgi:ubiquinone biosynthesis UbiH/UbiF/VisC/COQ6 family hydroxylase|tara:strand:- start:42972 stop:44177 length:1206 start_codon:yes stop_codon:yes gene_type:complete